MFSVSGGYLAAIAAWLQQAGYGTSPLCMRIRRIRSCESVSLEEAQRLLADAAQLTGDPLAALRAGQVVDWPYLGALGHMLASARTLEELLNNYVFHEALFYGTNIANLHREPGSLTLYWNARGQHRDFACFSISAVAAMIRRVGMPAECIAAISLPLGDDVGVDRYARLLACSDIRSGETLGITIRREFLGREIRVRDRARDRAALMRELLPEISDAAFASRLYDEIVAGLPQRNVNLASMAKSLAMSPRTLQRRLSVVPDGLRGAVGRVRMQLAREYLGDESMTLVAVSLLLGYSEQSAFQLAFRKRAGVSPGRWRSGEGKGTGSGADA